MSKHAILLKDDEAEYLDDMAKEAMQALVVNSGKAILESTLAEDIAESAYRVARGMLKARRSMALPPVVYDNEAMKMVDPVGEEERRLILGDTSPTDLQVKEYVDGLANEAEVTRAKLNNP